MIFTDDPSKLVSYGINARIEVKWKENASRDVARGEIESSKRLID